MNQYPLTSPLKSPTISPNKKQQQQQIPPIFFLNKKFINNNLREVSDKEIIITNFYHKLKLLQVQKNIYTAEYNREINNIQSTILQINEFFNSFITTLGEIQNEIITNLKSIECVNLSGADKLNRDNSLLESIMLKYPQFQDHDQDSDLQTSYFTSNDNDKLLELMVDNEFIDRFIDENSEKALVSSRVDFDKNAIQFIQNSLDSLITIASRTDAMNYTNYFKNHEKVITNTQSLHDICCHYMGVKINSDNSSSGGSNTSRSPSISPPLSIRCSPSQSPRSTSPSPPPSLSEIANVANNIQYGGVSNNSSLLIGRIKSLNREEYLEYLEGMAPIYVVQLSYYYEMKTFDRHTMLKYINYIFDDSYTSANYFCQKIETMCHNNLRKLPRLPYLTSLKLLIEEITTFSHQTRYLKKIGILQFKKNSALDIKSFIYFDDFVEIRCKRILVEVRLSKEIQFIIQGGTFKNPFSFKYSFINENSVVGISSLNDLNDKGLIPWCYNKRSSNTFSNGVFSTIAAFDKLQGREKKFFSKYVNDIIHSASITVSIGNASISFNFAELSNEQIDYMYGEYYRSLTSLINDDSDGSGGGYRAISCDSNFKVYALIHFIAPAFFYYLYNHPYRFDIPMPKSMTNNKNNSNYNANINNYNLDNNNNKNK